MKKYLLILFTIFSSCFLSAQINTERVTLIGRNALYFEDYVLAIQYFNQVIKAKPYLAEPYYYRAIAKYYLDDFKGSEDDCTLCLERNPFLTGAYQLRADARQNQKNYKGALADYKLSLKENPNDKFILINLGIVNIEDKKFDEAEKYLNDLIKIHPNYTQGILTRANLYLEEKDTIKALEDLNLAIEKDKYFSPSFSMRGSVYLMQKEYDKALTDYDEAIKLDPITTANYINRGLTKYYKNDLRGSMADYDHVITIDPNNIMAHFNRALLRSQVGDDNRAINDFDFVIKNEPDNYIAYMNRALLKNNIGDVKGALTDLNKVLKEYPDFYQGYQIRSDIKRKQNDLKGAEQDFYAARNIEEKVKREVLSGKAPKKDKENNKTREKSDKTIDKFNLLVVADKEEAEKNKYNSETRGKVQNKQANIELLASYSVSYYEKENELQKFIHFNKDIDKLNRQNILSRKLVITNQEVPLDSVQIEIHFASINEYSKLIGEQPENSVLYFARGLDYMLVQDFASAIEDFSKATSLDPKFTLAYFNLAVAYTKQLKSKLSVPELYAQDNTLNEFTMNMPLNGTKTAASSNIGDNTKKSISTKIDYEQIISNYNKVIELSPDFIFAYYNKAEVKAMQNDFRGAILDYNEAIRHDSDFADAYYNRGLCRLRVKDNERGLDDLRKAGEFGIINAYSIIKRMTE